MTSIHFLFIYLLSLLAITDSETTYTRKEQKPRYRVMFWNVENLFDMIDDPLSNDDEFTPGGIRRWSYQRYMEKINKVYKVIVASGNPSPPEIIGLCELENTKVLHDLTVSSPFFRFNYEFIHMDSPDSRGIDVAVLYDPSKVEILNTCFFNPFSMSMPSLKTRYILYMEAIIHKSDTVHVFFNHWPSKYGGKGISEPLRILAAKGLKHYTDSIFSALHNPSIIITGDFNDSPEDISICKYLEANCNTSGKIENNKLYNLSCEAKPGTYKYQGIWEVLDQFIVSGSLINASRKPPRKKPHFEIFQAEFLLIKDEAYPGIKPFRTWEGFKYKGGYSDHLPVILSVF
jgi:hypothetical protein